jgi:ribosomal protein S19E (S16A)
MEGEGTTYNGKNVKDVPAEDFISAFAAHLKQTNKVGSTLSHSVN